MSDRSVESRRIAVGKGAGLTADAMDMAESFVKELALDDKTTLRMRLLTEEVLEMLRNMLDGFSGLFWLEADGSECRLCIDGTADVDLAAEQSLLAVTKDGKNSAVRGFTAKLAHFVRHHREYLEHLNSLMSVGSAAAPEDYLYIGAMQSPHHPREVMWSMLDYRRFLRDDTSAAEQIAADRDELEKSILANLADDVRVGVKDDRVRITVMKKL